MAEKAAKQADRFVHGQFLGELRILQLDAEALAEPVRVRAPPPAKHFDFSGIRRRETFADFDSCRFSGAIRPKKAEALSRVHFKVETVDCNHVPVCFSQLADA